MISRTATSAFLLQLSGMDHLLSPVYETSSLCYFRSTKDFGFCIKSSLKHLFLKEKKRNRGCHASFGLHVKIDLPLLTLSDMWHLCLAASRSSG